MGIFNFNSQLNPGPGVPKNQPEKKRVPRFFELLARKLPSICVLNMVYAIFCIPIITIGPMTTGLMYVLRNFSTETPGFPVSDMLSKAWENKRQGVGWFFFQLLLTAILFLSMQMIISMDMIPTVLFYLLFWFLIVAYALVTFMSYYAYLQIAFLRLDLNMIILNAFIFAIIKIKTNIITFLLTHMIIVLSILFLPITLLFIVLLGFGLVHFIICFNSYRHIELAVHADQDEKQESETTVFSDDDISNKGNPRR